jgi:hypothetical protein
VPDAESAGLPPDKVPLAAQVLPPVALAELPDTEQAACVAVAQLQTMKNESAAGAMPRARPQAGPKRCRFERVVISCIYPTLVEPRYAKNV